MNTFPNWIGVNVVLRGHHFKSRRAGGTEQGQPTDHSHAKWQRLSQRLAISWSIMPLNTLFRHLFCTAAVMHVMPRGWKQSRGRGRGSERGRERSGGSIHAWGQNHTGHMMIWWLQLVSCQSYQDTLKVVCLRCCTETLFTETLWHHIPAQF